MNDKKVIIVDDDTIEKRKLSTINNADGTFNSKIDLANFQINPKTANALNDRVRLSNADAQFANQNKTGEPNNARFLLGYYSSLDSIDKIILALIWSSLIILASSIIAIIIMSSYTYSYYLIFSLPDYAVVYTLLVYGLVVSISALIAHWVKRRKQEKKKKDEQVG